MTDAGRLGLEGWVRKLSASGLPIFSQTVHEVSDVATRRESSARDLAEAIGRDASLSARLLKIANSPLFNLQNRTIDTISSAVVMVGFDAIRELAVSLAFVEHVLKGHRHARVTQGMSLAFHAAAQARSFAANRKDRCPEEVFVAALLLRIGEMAFWSAADAEAAAIERLIRSGVAQPEAERQVLGFPLEALTRRLVDEWHLGGLIEEAIARAAGPRVADVQLGHEVALAVEQSGWKAARVSRVIDKVTAHLGISRAAAMELVHANAEEAAKIAAWYGVPAIQSYLLQNEPPRPRVAPNAELQLDTLKRIADHLDGQVDLDELLHLVLDGIQRGIGMSHTFFALLSADGRSLQVRHMLGGGIAGMIPLKDSAEEDLFRAALASGRLMHVTRESSSLQALLTEEIVRRTALPFVIMPIKVDDRSVGLLYADMAPNGRAIDTESLSAFRHFGQQISLALASRSK